MKRIFYFFIFLFFYFSLSSCNLFIDEEPVVDDYGFSNVPVHTGEGYDKPVTTTQGDCEVTYQLKSNVRQLTLEDTRQWITYVAEDNTQLFMEIHYSAHTPQDRLPVPGEILLSTDIQTFPHGCMHRIQMRELRDGEYYYIASPAKLDETYQTLDINGAMTTQSNEEYDVEAEPDDSTATARNTRADFSDPDWYNVGGLHVKVGDEIGLGFDFPTIPLININDDKHHISTTVQFLEGSYSTITEKLDFTDFSLQRNVFKIRTTVCEESKIWLKVSGSYYGSMKIKHFRPIKGKPVIIGPVVLVLFVNLNFDLEYKLTGESTFEREYSCTRTCENDLANSTVKKTETYKDSGWKISAIVSGDIGIRTTLELCMGFYGKILTVRLKPSTYAGFKAESAPIVMLGDNDEKTYDASSLPTVKFLWNWQIDAGIFIEMSVFDWLKSLFSKIYDELTKKNIGAVLDDLVEAAADNMDWYKELSSKNEDESSIFYGANVPAWALEDEEGTIREEKDDKTGFTIPFGPWTIYESNPVTWFPRIDDNSFKIHHLYNEEEKKMEFIAEYTIKKKGFFGLFDSYVPGMLIKKGTKIVDRLYPDSEGKGARVKEGQLYMFILPNYEDDQTYQAVPCYYCMPLSRYNPDIIDKGLPYMGTTPSVTINQITPTSAEVDEGMFFDYYGEDMYKYQFTYKFDINITMRGADNISHWGVYEGNHLQSFNYKPKDATKLRDGTYVLHCVMEILSNYNYDGRIDDLRLYPFFFSDEMTGNEYHTGTTTHLFMTPDGYYKIDDGPTHKL